MHTGSPLRRCAVALVIVSFSVAGCGDAGVGKTYPVSGKVTLNGQPLIAKSGVVVFKPNTAKGNTTAFEPSGSIDDKGNYTLYTKTQKGAPPGWYKVIVTAVEPESAVPTSKKALTQRPVPKSLVPGRYGQDKSTTLDIEVVEKAPADAYDLKLTD